MIVFLAGPIEYWWEGEWDTEDHRNYVAWREGLSRELVARGHLVYRPHEAFKGAWEPNGGAQDVNNRALELADLVLVSNYDPPVRCHGTDAEVEYVRYARRDRRLCHAELEFLRVPRRHDLGSLTLGEAIRARVTQLEIGGLLDTPPRHPEYLT